MKTQFKNIAQLGAILAPSALLCGLFHHQLFGLFCTAIEGLAWLATGFFLLFLALSYGTVCLVIVLAYCYMGIAPILLINHFVFSRNRL